MKASELRIGNWVSDAVSRKPIQMTGTLIEWKEKNDISGLNPFDLGEIPLTEGWLLKLGLIFIEKIQELKYYWLNDTGLFAIRESKYNDRAYDLVVHVRIDETVFIMSFDYVHEIQNYFSLTGEELKINIQ